MITHWHSLKTSTPSSLWAVSYTHLLRDDIAEQPQVRVLVAVDIADLLRRAGHLPVSGEIVEELSLIHI